MPRPASPPRLYLRDRKGRPAVWVILHHGREIGTGAFEPDQAKAHAAFAAYLGKQHKPAFRQGDPAQVLIADVLSFYSEHHAPSRRRPDLIAGAAGKLDQFFGASTVATVDAVTCGNYVSWRCAQPSARSKHGDCVKPTTARRELGVLSAALRWCWKQGKLDRLVPVTLPPQGEPRERHLTRTEAALLLAAALGWYRGGWCDRVSRREHWIWRRAHARINRHLARFILVGIYSGTRHDAILKLQWISNLAGGHVDLDAGVLYRRPQGATESAKRRPPLPIPPRLMPHLRRWQKLTKRFVIEWKGKPIASQERRAWAGARAMAWLGPDVTPHVMKHTFVTWLLQQGESVYDVAGAAGTSENVIRQTYGHHAHDHLRRAVAAFSRRGRP